MSRLENVCEKFLDPRRVRCSVGFEDLFFEKEKVDDLIYRCYRVIKALPFELKSK